MSKAIQNGFENDVKMYGTQTEPVRCIPAGEFENDVKMYGTQTCYRSMAAMQEFENVVKMYGTQTNTSTARRMWCLRMM